MDGPRDYPAKWSKPDREKHIFDIALYVIFKNKNEQENKLVGYQGGKEGRGIN